uniref:Uncharacterized protein n=1 Tax=Malurus cyaneus samueli TaxID=2593467 RepID=A0A8C5X549_9PASS
MKRQNVRTRGAHRVYFTYLLVGAAVFDALESEAETAEKRGWRPRARVKTSKPERRELPGARAGRAQAQAAQAGVQWKFAGSFYFAITVIPP